MLLGQLLRETRLTLESHGILEASIEAELFLMKTLGLERSQLYSYLDKPVASEDIESLKLYLSRRFCGEPWPYICGYREFYGIKIRVNPSVFIPRPETELLVDLALDYAHMLSIDRQLFIADACTGSGAVAIALALHLPQAVVYATDISREALDTALLNCKDHSVDNRVILIEGNLLSEITTPLDIVVSNPPYIPSDDIYDLDRDVLSEPLIALDGGKDGLDIVRSLIPQVVMKLRKPGMFIMETFPDNSEEACTLFHAYAPKSSIALHLDFAGKQRAMLAKIY